MSEARQFSKNLSLSFGALLLLALRVEALCPAYIHVWPARALAGVGAHSYSIYLWHIPVIFWCGRGLKQELPSLPYLPSVTLLVCASLVVGWGAARLIELPVLKFRDRFFPSRSIGAIPVASGPGPA